MKNKVSAVLSLMSIIQLDSASWLLGLSVANTNPQLLINNTHVCFTCPCAYAGLQFAIWLFGMHALLGHAT